MRRSQVSLKRWIESLAFTNKPSLPEPISWLSRKWP